MKQPRKFGWPLVCILAIIAIGGIALDYMYNWSKPTLVYTQQELQAKINAKMPYTNDKYGTTINSLQLGLDGDYVIVTFDGHMTKFRQTLSGNGTAGGHIRLELIRGNVEIFVEPKELTLSDVELNGKDVKERVENILKKAVGSKRAERWSGTADRAVQNAIFASAKHVLRNTPIWKSKDDFKGHIIRMAVTDVEVKDSKVIIHLSVWQFTKILAVYLAVAVLALGLALVLAIVPGAGFLSILSL